MIQASCSKEAATSYWCNHRLANHSCHSILIAQSVTVLSALIPSLQPMGRTFGCAILASCAYLIATSVFFIASVAAAIFAPVVGQRSSQKLSMPLAIRVFGGKQEQHLVFQCQVFGCCVATEPSATLDRLCSIVASTAIGGSFINLHTRNNASTA